MFVRLWGLQLCEWLHKSLYASVCVGDNDVQAYVWVYPRYCSLCLLCVCMCVCECITGKQWLMSALLSSVSWSVPEANKRAPAFLCLERFRKTAKTAHEPFITAQPHRAIMNSMTPMKSHSCVLSEHLSLDAVRLTWHPLPNQQHLREMTHVALWQQNMKLVVKHYSFSVDMEIVECGGNTDTCFRPVMLI